MKLKILIFQKKTDVGDFENNFSKLEVGYNKATKEKCDLFITSELALCGYPPKDLINRNDFISKLNYFKKKIIDLTKQKQTTFLLGTIIQKNNDLFNSVLIIKDGKIIKNINKSILPNYGVFDEKRYFKQEEKPQEKMKLKKLHFNVFICEDLWNEEFVSRKEKSKADFNIVVNASPYDREKYTDRIRLVKNRVKILNSPVLYVNLVGGQDDLIFDGGSFCINKERKLVFQAPFFKEYDDTFTFDFNKKNKTIKSNYNKMQNLYDALVLSFRDYMNGSGFSRALMGISGGIDSALSLSLACDSIGKKNVMCVFLPTKFTSNESLKDSEMLCKNLGIKLEHINIEYLRKQFNLTLKKPFKKFVKDVTEENIQSRIRGSILMAISNKFNSMLITTGNKSELAVGYSTIYGDMCGGYSIIKDLYKSDVYRISRWRNKNFTPLCKCKFLNIIPKNIITKEPTAELKFNQKDRDYLPSYDILDNILYCIIDENLSLSEIIKKGFEKKLIIKIWKMILRSEYKRFQSVIGPKVSKMNFDSDRRFPIVNRFKIDT